MDRVLESKSLRVEIRRTDEKRITMKSRIAQLLTVLALGASFPVFGSTVAYWRFEEGPANALLNHTVGDGVYQQAVADSSGNGYGLSAWSSGDWASSYYRNNTLPATTIPQTGAANNFSIKNAGGYPGMFTDPSAAIRTISPAQFTIEAMFKPESGGWRRHERTTNRRLLNREIGEPREKRKP